jgi:maleylacetoacetate isomerase
MASTPKLVLYTYWRSSSSYRVRLALAAKKVAHEQVFVNLLKGEQKAPEHLARNPLGYVPCLFVDGRPFVESVAIIELLEDLFPAVPLYPRDPFARARVRAICEFINASVQPFQNLAVLERVSSDHDVRKDWARHFIVRGLEAIEALMAAHEQGGDMGPFAYGATFGAADAFLVPQVYSAKRFGVDLARFARVRRAYEAATATDAARQAAPENQPDAVAS